MEVMEKPKTKKQSKEVQKQPEHELELEHNPEPLRGEAFEDWLRRIGGPFVRVELLKKCPKCGGTIFEQEKHACKPTSKQQEQMPLIIDKNATFIANKENVGNYFNEEMIEEGLQSDLKEWQENAQHIKERDEYQLKKELFETPAKYLKIITKELEDKNGKIVADRRFGNSVEKWIKESRQKPKTEKKEPDKAEEKAEERREPTVGDEVIWESGGEAQWKEPKKITRMEEYKGQKFAFFKGSETGIPVDQLILEKPEEKLKQEAKKEKGQPTAEKKLSTLDERIEQKQKELEEVEIDYNIYYSPRVESLFGLAYKFRRKNLKKELKGLRKEAKKEKVNTEKAKPEKQADAKSYLEHIRKTDNLFTEMTKTRGKVKRGEVDKLEYENKKKQWRAAYNKTIEMEGELTYREVEKVIKKREKDRKKSKIMAEIKKKWKHLWDLIVDKFGKEIVNEVTEDAINEQLKVVNKKLKNISKKIKQAEVIDRSKLEKKEKNLEKDKKRLKKLKKKFK